MSPVNRIARWALVASYAALGLAVVGLVLLTISAVLGGFSWGGWALALLMTGVLGRLVSRTRRRVNTAAPRDGTRKD